MAALMTDLYKLVGQEFGISGRMKFAMLTKISSEKAQTIEDTPENIKIFEQALQKLRATGGK